MTSRGTHRHDPGIPLFAIAAIVAACAAALLAHVAIDIAANFYAAHDPYDDIAHGSRLAAFAGVLALAAVAALSVVSLAARSRDEALLTLFSAIERRPAWAFAAAVIAGSLAALVAMETLDSFAATGHTCSLAAALGGVPAAGIAIEAAIAWAVARAVRRALLVLAAAHRHIARTIRVFIFGFAGASGVMPQRDSCGLIAVAASSPLARSGAFRAPPL